MSYKRKHAKKDTNHDEIVKALRGIGCFVMSAEMVGGGYPDIVAAMRPTDTVMIEIKTPEGMFDIRQLRTLAESKMYSAFAASIEEAIRIVRNPSEFALTEREKLIILRICLSYENKSKSNRPRIEVAKFEKLFAEAKEKLAERDLR